MGDGCEYVFSISNDSNGSSDSKVSVKIGGLPVTMIIDSGASCNVIGLTVWEIRLHVCRVRLPRSCMEMVVVSHYNLQASLLQKCLFEESGKWRRIF